ncbi:hypothetical protein pb186bvf_017145 [Paramecium bursaria]
MDQIELDHMLIMDQEEQINKLRITVVQLQNEKSSLLQDNHDLNMQSSRQENIIIGLNEKIKDYQQLVEYSRIHNEGQTELSKKLSSDNLRLNDQINNLLEALQGSLQQIKDLQQNLKQQFYTQNNELGQKNTEYVQLQLCNMKLQAKIIKYKSQFSFLRQQTQNLERKFQEYKKQQVYSNFKICFAQFMSTQSENNNSQFDINVERFEQQFFEDLNTLIDFSLVYLKNITDNKFFILLKRINPKKLNHESTSILIYLQIIQQRISNYIELVFVKQILYILHQNLNNLMINDISSAVFCLKSIFYFQILIKLNTFQYLQNLICQ